MTLPGLGQTIASTKVARPSITLPSSLKRSPVRRPSGSDMPARFSGKDSRRVLLDAMKGA